MKCRVVTCETKASHEGLCEVHTERLALVLQANRTKKKLHTKKRARVEGPDELDGVLKWTPEREPTPVPEFE